MNSIIATSSSSNNNNRSGKWSAEEEKYSEALMEAFHAGLLSDVEEGVSLRKVLAKKLFCSAKRISKKFEGTNYNGKMIYLKKTDATKQELADKKAHLQTLEKKFLDSIPYNFLGQAAQDSGTSGRLTSARAALSVPSALQAGALANAGLVDALHVQRSTNPHRLPLNGVFGAGTMDTTSLPLAGTSMAATTASLFPQLHTPSAALAASWPSSSLHQDPLQALARDEAYRTAFARRGSTANSSLTTALASTIQQPILPGTLTNRAAALAGATYTGMDRITELLATTPPSRQALASARMQLLQESAMLPTTTNLTATAAAAAAAAANPADLGLATTSTRQQQWMGRTAASALMAQQQQLLEEQKQILLSRQLASPPVHVGVDADDGNCQVQTTAQSTSESRKRPPEADDILQSVNFRRQRTSPPYILQEKELSTNKRGRFQS